MNVRPTSLATLRLPSAIGGADPLAAAHRSGAALDKPDEESRAMDGQAKTETSLEEEIGAKARQAAADQQTAAAIRQARDFELNTRRADAVNCVARARVHDRRKLCTPHDASVMWQIADLLHSITGGKPANTDVEFDEPDSSRPINSAVDRAISGAEASLSAEMLRVLASVREEVAELRRAAQPAPADSGAVPDPVPSSQPEA
jgi:hypothetical protein